MHAVVGDRLHVHGRVVGTPDQTSEIIEIRDGTGRRRTSSATTTGMRRSCFLGRTRRWSTRRAARAPEVDGLGLFEPIPLGRRRTG